MRLCYLYLTEDITSHQKQIDATARRIGISPDKLIQYMKPIVNITDVYVPWLLKQIKQKNIRLPEDSDRVIETLSEFDKYRQRLPYSDISQYRTIHDLEEAIDELLERDDTRAAEKERAILSHGVEKYRESANYSIYEITTKDACLHFAAGTRWCISDSEVASGYLKDYGELYTIFRKKGDNLIKYGLYTPDFRQVTDLRDKSLEVDEELAILMEPDESQREWVVNYAMYVLEDRYKPAEEKLLSEPDASMALEYAQKAVGGRWPEGENIIKQEPIVAYAYAHMVSKGRWKNAEPNIIKNPHVAYLYARDVIRGRWLEAEPIMLEDMSTAISYARDVIGGRWPELESVILHSQEDQDDAFVAAQYAGEVIKGVWPEAERIIMLDPDAAYIYARDIIRERFPEAEPTILKDLHVASRYAGDVIGDRWEALEEKLLKVEDIATTYNYTLDVVGGRWPEAEHILRKDPDIWKGYTNFVYAHYPRQLYL